MILGAVVALAMLSIHDDGSELSRDVGDLNVDAHYSNVGAYGDDDDDTY